MSITNGDRVEIVGLVARTDLNGSLGTVERLARDGEDRWRVKLDGKEKKLASWSLISVCRAFLVWIC